MSNNKKPIKRTQQQPHALQVAMRQQTFSGPLPPPEYLERYEAICPGAADRVITLAEKQSEHRQKLEASTVTTNNNAMRRGQIFAFIIAMAGITAATIIALNNQPTVASVIGGASLISLVSAFIGGKVSQNKSLKEKSKQVE